MLSKLIPLMVMGGVSMHSKDLIKENIDRLIGAKDQLVTKQRMDTVMRVIRLNIASGDDPNIDSTRTLLKFIEVNVKIDNDVSDPTRDFWGTRFRYISKGHLKGIASAGPDREFDTSDDIKILQNIYDF